jgi:hypothetical protein
MKEFVLDIFTDVNFIELLFLTLFLLGLPVSLYFKAADSFRETSFRKRDTLRGAAFSIGAILIGVFDLWVAIVLGPDIVLHAQVIFGPTLFLLIFTIVASSVLVAISYTGLLLRAAWRRGNSNSRRSQNRKSGKKILASVATSGVIIGAVLLVCFAPLKPALAGILLMSLALSAGWFGRVILLKPWRS